MAGAPRVRSMNAADPEARPVLGPAGNKAKSPAKKLVSKPSKKTEEGEKSRSISSAVADVESLPLSPVLSAPSLLRRHELLLHSNLSLNASCSSDASTDSFSSRASKGRIDRAGFTARRSRSLPKPVKVSGKLEKIVTDGISLPPLERGLGKRRCAWVTSNTEQCYAAFHDEEWGVAVHEDRKLFELLVLSGALAELTWPTILSKRHIFREVFLDFDPMLVSKLNEKKLVSSGSNASSLLSEPKLRSVVENARQIVKIAEEFGSFDRYCWGFVNYKPIVGGFRHPRQIPVKTPKADVISKDMIRRGFRSVGPTVIYSFMQAIGITNDHLIGCFRFSECSASSFGPAEGNVAAEEAAKVAQKLEKTFIDINCGGGVDVADIDSEMSRAVDGFEVGSLLFE